MGIINSSMSIAAGVRTIYGGRTADNFTVGHQRLAIWGQSNAIARGDQSELSASPLSSDPDLADYMNGTIPFTRSYIWTGSSFAILTASNNGAATGQFGPEFGYAVRWERETTGGNIYFTKAAVSGAPIGTTFGAGDPVYGYIYRNYRDEHRAAAAWMDAAGLSCERDDWLWIQGEADYQQTQNYYQTKLSTLMAYRLADGLENNLSMRVLAKMKVGSLVWSQAVDDAKEAIAATDPTHIKTVRMDYYKSAGDAHQNARGVVQTAYDAFSAIHGRPTINT